MTSCLRPALSFPAALLLLVLAGCGRPPLPESATAIGDVPYPELVPAQQILSGGAQEPRISESSEASLAARAALLRRRAAELRAREFDT
ncbi:hypothetical protein SAMN06297129_3435 [Pseudooceanicola antarcticus]|uniref:Beta-barrel assembly machine subunit BamF n=1 Tax=Pseudooceanicola antarcticus TaxID=1247613 RepID=A0A285JBX3_9RHOB|nr:hypothetical protein [Pseudooceanicola antarcticus]PJE30902.1 hypothetical protein CVM39_05515 [Pseudooceanicola antarcticus]SNY57742.1 hypothetical protein SAMN06297129_3435 [Pseudooceanicola antarcticus]